MSATTVNNGGGPPAQKRLKIENNTMLNNSLSSQNEQNILFDLESSLPDELITQNSVTNNNGGLPGNSLHQMNAGQNQVTMMNNLSNNSTNSLNASSSSMGNVNITTTTVSNLTNNANMQQPSQSSQHQQLSQLLQSRSNLQSVNHMGTMGRPRINQPQAVNQMMMGQPQRVAINNQMMQNPIASNPQLNSQLGKQPVHL